MYYILWIIVFIFFLWIFLIIKFSKKNKINLNTKKDLEKKFKQIKSINSNKEKIIDYDKLFHKILHNLWYSWTFWEILKTEPRIISDINKIWELHKFRNKLVHDFDLMSENVLKLNALEYEKIISELFKRI